MSGDYANLFGPDGSEEMVLKRYEQMTPLAQALGTRISSLTLDRRGAWRLDLDSGLALKLGRDNRLDRIAPYIAALPQILGERFSDAASIDLRYSNGFAVRWRQKAEPQEGQAS